MKSKGIGIVYDGIIDQYYYLKLKSQLSFKETCDVISKNIDLFLGVPDTMKELTSEEELHDLPLKDVLDSNVSDEYNRQVDCNDDSHKYKKEIYGAKYLGSYKSFVFPPFKARLINGEKVWIHSVFYLFENMVGVLKIGLPLINSHVDFLKDINYDDYMVELENSCFLPFIQDEISVESIRNSYIRSILGLGGIDCFCDNWALVNIILGQFEGQPKHINLLTSELEQDIYKIVCAPVRKENANFEDEAHEYLERNSFQRNDINYTISSMGRCLSFAGESIIDDSIRDNMIENDRELGDIVPIITEKLIRRIRDDSELAFLVIILKRMNENALLEEKKYTKRSMCEVQEDYHKNKIFIAEIQEGCYGNSKRSIKGI